MTVPRLNPLAGPVLCGLLYRALAADIDGTGADLTRRSLEQLQADGTNLLQELSSLRAEYSIQEQRALESARNARQADLDLQLFERQHPVPPPRRGLFAPRLTPEQRALRAKRTELSGIAAVEGAEAARHKDLAAAMEKRLEALSARREEVQSTRGDQAMRFQSELAANVLGQAAAGQYEEARLTLADARAAARGDAMVAALLVLLELLGGGTDAALVMLGELKPLFRQHPDPLPRVLGTLIGLRHGGGTTRRDVGAFGADSFSTPAFNRLYQLVRVLAGWSFDEAGLEGDPFAATLWILREHTYLAAPPEGWQAPPVDFVVDWAAEAEPVARGIALNVLLQHGALDRLAGAAGIDPNGIPAPRRRNETWPALTGLLGEPPPAWPAALAGPWQVFCACHVMLGARETAPQPLYEHWLAECYNWPKDDMYWWMLARLQDDEQLLKNLKRDPTQSVTIPL